jgi:hypothetical protein
MIRAFFSKKPPVERVLESRELKAVSVWEGHGISLIGLSCFSTFYKETSCFFGRRKGVFRPYN